MLGAAAQRRGHLRQRSASEIADTEAAILEAVEPDLLDASIFEDAIDVALDPPRDLRAGVPGDGLRIAAMGIAVGAAGLEGP